MFARKHDAGTVDSPWNPSISEEAWSQSRSLLRLACRPSGLTVGGSVFTRPCAAKTALSSMRSCWFDVKDAFGMGQKFD